jgi:hypothetical protein
MAFFIGGHPLRPLCLHKRKDGETTYYHRIAARTIVRPGDSVVLPEPIQNEDGAEKQDAVKQWLKKHGSEYAWLSPALSKIDVDKTLLSGFNFCPKFVLNMRKLCYNDTYQWIF